MFLFFCFSFAAVAALVQPWRGDERDFQCNVSPARLGISVSKPYRLRRVKGRKFYINDEKLAIIYVALLIFIMLYIGNNVGLRAVEPPLYDRGLGNYFR